MVAVAMMLHGCDQPFWTCTYEIGNGDTIRLTENGTSAVTSNTMDIEYCRGHRCAHLANYEVGGGPIVRLNGDEVRITVYSKDLDKKWGWMRRVTVENYPKEKFLQDPGAWNRLVEDYGMLHACAENGRRIY